MKPESNPLTARLKCLFDRQALCAVLLVSSMLPIAHCSSAQSGTNNPAPDKPETPLLLSPKLASLDLGAMNHPLKIDDAVSLALRLNRSIAFARAALLKAEARTAITRTALNPVIGATPAYVYEERSLQGDGFIGATVPIDIAGTLHAATDQAKFIELAYRLDINRTRNQVTADVKAAFYEVLRSKALLRVADENLTNTKERLNDAEKKLQARAVTRFDVVRAQTDVANAEQQVIRAQNAVKRNIGGLNSVIGLDILTPLKLDELGSIEQPAVTTERETKPFDASENLGPQFQSNLNDALKLRPEIMETEANIDAAKKGITLAKRSESPSLGFSIGYYNQRNSTANVRIDDPRASVNLSLPLYDGGLARARKRDAISDVATAEVARRQAIDLVTLDVQQAYLNLLQAREQIRVADQGLVQARQAFELARVRYNAGVAARAGISPLLELSDAQAALTLAEGNQVNAVYDYNNSRAQLARAVGK